MSEVSYENFTFQFEDSREVTLLRTEVLEFSPSFYYHDLLTTFYTYIFNSVIC